ncbi:MAG: type VI secretion system-associated protein TagF [Mesorhizobium amorphae]|nr:MAG: type VI secretion system-associated protein TagF [Mesorhizobium amorphae]
MRGVAERAPPPPAESGFFGKVASHGDFVASRFDRSLRDLLDGWLQRSLDHERRERGDGWRASFAKMPIWRFVLGAEVAGRAPVIGVMGPSADRVGRAFPLFVVRRVPGYRGPTRALSSETAWFAAAEKLLRQAAHPGFQLSSFDSDLTELPSLAGAPRAYSDLPPEAGHSFWWTEERRAGGRRFAAIGLPAPTSFGRFLGDSEVSAPVAAPRAQANARVAPELPRLRVASSHATHAGARLRVNAARVTDPALAHIHALADSQTATAQATELAMDRLSRVAASSNLSDLVAATKGALGTANTLLRTGATGEPPSAAVVALVSTARDYAVVWAGDARAYLLRDGLMRLLTRDHLEVGLRRRLSRSVGGSAQFSCDTAGDVLHAGDRFLLASSALVRAVPERLMAERLGSLAADETAGALVQEALVGGVAENVAAVVIDFAHP